MYITCPSCSTSYEVDGTQIGPQGRLVRCFNCHHSWHQYPVAAQPPMRAAPPPQPARYVPQPAYADSYSDPIYRPERPASRDPYGRGHGPQAHAMPAAAPMAYAAPLPDPEPLMMPEPMVRAAPAPEPVRAAPPAPPPKAAPAPAPKPAPAPVEDLPSDDDLDDMLGPNRADAASKMFGGGAGRDESGDIDEDKIQTLPDPEPVRQVYAGKVDDDDFDDDIEIDDIPDPDPIPTVYGGSDDDDDEDLDDDLDEKGGGIKRLIAPAITIVAIGAIVAGLFLARDRVVKLVPQANDYLYDLVGLHVMVPGEGLKRELTRTAMETVAEVDHVIATGLITNVSDKEQPLPQVLVQLIDANEKVLSSKTMTLEKATLQPGEVLQFKAVFEGAPATARKVRTDWGPFATGPAPVETH